MQPAVESRRLHVIVVDDSAVVRRTLDRILSVAGAMRVTTAADPLFALQKMDRDPPDVLVLDLEMPRMDGLTFLRRLMAERPLPVVVCSALAGPDSDVALRALQEGAVEVVAKPRIAVREFLEESTVLLVDAVCAAAQAGRRLRRPSPVALRGSHPGRPELHRTSDHVIALGASTGGTEALRAILPKLPPDAPGLVVVQHMPEHFTRAFAGQLDALCLIAVKEAEDGDRVLGGRALIAPGNRHMTVARDGAHYVVHVADGPLISRHRPSVDVLFSSVARSAGPNATGVILTGMGDDGARGLLEMKRAGAHTLAQDEASSVVFGMPQSAIDCGAVDEVVPVSRMAAALPAASPRLSG